LAADLHRLDVVSEPPTTADMFVEDTLARCERLQNRWPQTRDLVEPLTDALQEALTCVKAANPGPVHGDLAAGQFVWTGERLVLLDLDMFGYADPAYDAGHFLAQLERRCLWDSTVRANASHWMACFRDAYFAAMPEVSPHNVAFYHGLTLVRKIYTICRTQREQAPQLIPQLAAHARAALEEVASPSQVESAIYGGAGERTQ
jgi:aminoglycoside phosphotransferase (APT) family kinase protein